MMTPDDIRDRKFEKGMGGYRTEEVHLFLSQVAEQMIDLEEENRDLLDKLEVLAEKLEQYREDEESLRAALIGAQKLGQSVVKESQEKAEAIIAQALKKAEAIVGDAQKNIDKEALALARMQREVAGFREKIIRLYTEHLQMIQDLPEELLDVQSTPIQIAYEPPAPESIGIGEEADGEVPELVFREDEPRLEFTPVGAEPSTPKKDGNFPKRKRNYKELDLDQFFGEDKPVERQ